MSNKLTTLAINLLISESQLHRLKLCYRMLDVLNETIPEDFGAVELLLRKQFEAMVHACVENPSGSPRAALLALAEFYVRNYCNAALFLRLAA